jgi:inner membrane protein
MADDIGRLVQNCARYWLDIGVSRTTVEEMSSELSAHLHDAVADGRDPTDVVGPDAATFAEEWARERGAETGISPRFSSRRGRARLSVIVILLLTVGTVAWSWTTIATTPDLGAWRWVWTAAAVVLSVGEIFTMGFFLLPFGIGAGAAAVTAWLGAPILAHWLTFLGVSAATLVFLQVVIRRQDEGPPRAVGANRYLGSQAVVLETIDPLKGTGRVRVESEEWRASSEGRVIKAGTQVRVSKVQGTRLIVS